MTTLTADNSPSSEWIAVVGSRDFPYRSLVEQYMSQLSADVTVISGGARGVDRWAEEIAAERNLPCVIFRANWQHHGKKAGMYRNRDIVMACNRLTAFHHNNSPGTQHARNLAIELGKEVLTCYTSGKTILIPAKPAFKFAEGHILEASNAVLLCPVNLEGVMDGIALAFKQRFPDLERAYQAACGIMLDIGSPFFIESLSDKIIIMCLATKRKRNDMDRLDYIEKGFQWLVQHPAFIPKNTRLAIPPLGEGVLPWAKLEKLYTTYLTQFDCIFYGG